MSDLPKQLKEWIECEGDTWLFETNCGKWSSHSDEFANNYLSFKSGAEFAAHKLLADANKLVEALKFYKNHADCKRDFCQGDCSFCRGEKPEHRQALAEWKDKYHE